VTEDCSFATNARGFTKPLYGFALIGYSGFRKDLSKRHDFLQWFFLHDRAAQAHSLSFIWLILGPCDNICLSSRVGLTPTPTCLTGQGGITRCGL